MAKPSKVKTIKIDEAIKRGEKSHESINLRQPAAGELRGVRLTDLSNADVDSMIKVIPRISDPALTEDELSKMNPGDFTALAVGTATFLDQKSESPTK